MRLYYLLILFTSLAWTANGYSQTVTLDEKNSSLQSVLNKIKKQTGFTITHAEDLSKANKVTVKVADENIESVLNKIFTNQELSYQIVDKIIVIKQKKTTGEPGSKAGSILKNISGKIINEEGDPVGGSIIIKGTNRGTTTDNNGRFELNNVEENAVLVISGISIETREYALLNNAGNDIVITTKTKIASEEEVVIKTNYWETKKRLSTSNISKVTSKEISGQPVTSPLMALQGRVPGLEITTPGNSTPGLAPKIRIRGDNNLRVIGKLVGADKDGNYPLYVIDGVPVSAVPVNGLAGGLASGGYDPLSTINPENIESIEVLKDADATAIYGSRGANGVILITTKTKTGLEKTSLDVSAYRGKGAVANKLDLLNTEQYLSMRREALTNDGRAEFNSDYDLVFWDPTRFTDWQEELIGGASDITDMQLNVSGGNAYTSLRFGLGYHKETLVTPGSFNYQRVSGQFSANHQSKNTKFKLGIVTNYGLDVNKTPGSDLMIPALTLPPNAPALYHDDGTLNWELHDINDIGVLYNTWENPLAKLQSTNKTNNYNLITNVSVSYEILNGLSISANMGFTHFTSSTIVKGPISAQPPPNVLNPQRFGSAGFGAEQRTNLIIEPKINYQFHRNAHHFDVIIGTSFQENESHSSNIAGELYTSDAVLNSLRGAGQVRINFEDQTIYKYASVYGRIGYNFQEKYLLSLTGRRDGSSKFGPANQYGNFGAIGAGWIFSEENSIQKNFPWISFGKLRASYGITGNDAIQDYGFYNLFDITTGTYQGTTGYIPYALYNPSFKWESTKKMEAAAEFSFFDRRVGFEISWYRNRTDNQLINYSLSATTGFASVLTNFDALVQNTGWEGVITATPIKSRPFNWNISFNISLPRNKLVRFDGIEDSPYANYFKVGEPLSVQWLYVYTGVNPQTGLHEFEDLNKDGVISISGGLDRRLMNPMNPKFYGGINNSLQYKNFDLSFLFRFADQPGSRYFPQMPGMISNQSVEVLKRWFAPGDITNVQKFSSGSVGIFPYYNHLSISSFNQENASFLRLQTLSLGYNFSSALIRTTGLQYAKLFIQGQNLLTFTNYTGLDPETGSGLPPLRMITAGVQLRF